MLLIDQIMLDVAEAPGVIAGANQLTVSAHELRRIITQRLSALNRRIGSPQLPKRVVRGVLFHFHPNREWRSVNGRFVIGETHLSRFWVKQDGHPFPKQYPNLDAAFAALGRVL